MVDVVDRMSGSQLVNHSGISFSGRSSQNECLEVSHLIIESVMLVVCLEVRLVSDSVISFGGRPGQQNV